MDMAIGMAASVAVIEVAVEIDTVRGTSGLLLGMNQDNANEKYEEGLTYILGQTSNCIQYQNKRF